MSVNSTVASTRSASAPGPRPGEEDARSGRVGVLPPPPTARWSAPVNSTKRGAGDLARRVQSRFGGSAVVRAARQSTSVGTRIVGRIAADVGRLVHARSGAGSLAPTSRRTALRSRRRSPRLPRSLARIGTSLPNPSLLEARWVPHVVASDSTSSRTLVGPMVPWVVSPSAAPRRGGPSTGSSAETRSGCVAAGDHRDPAPLSSAGEERGSRASRRASSTARRSSAATSSGGCARRDAGPEHPTPRRSIVDEPRRTTPAARGTRRPAGTPRRRRRPLVVVELPDEVQGALS